MTADEVTTSVNREAMMYNDDDVIGNDRGRIIISVNMEFS